MRHVLFAGLALIISGCGYIPFSGGKLDGTPSPNPADWTEVAAADVIELETNPTDPYSVKLWIVGMGPRLYVHAGANRTTWVEHIEVEPKVRVLIEGKLYDLRAIQVHDQAEFAAFAAAYESKYGNRPRNENIAEIYLYRLES